ncbi:MAG: heavy-metal-associated domain-containing protein [Anaerolineae bacterium]|nr:heavy-metal-associated domain-containing protein [Anaerolineae bacterium]
MKKICFDLPTMYADHHVVEVRRLLLDLPGVVNVYASSAFHMVEIEYDGKKTNEDALKQALETSGYLGNFPFDQETAKPPGGQPKADVFFRRSKLIATTKNAVSFGQVVASQNRPLWPCPGLSPVNGKRN